MLPTEKIVTLTALLLVAIVLLFPLRRAVYIREGDNMKAELGPCFILAHPSAEEIYRAIFDEPLQNDFTYRTRLRSEIDYGRVALLVGSISAVSGICFVATRSRRRSNHPMEVLNQGKKI